MELTPLTLSASRAKSVLREMSTLKAFFAYSRAFRAYQSDYHRQSEITPTLNLSIHVIAVA